MSNILNIGIHSLAAYEYAITITGQNLGNVGNDKYSRRQVSLVEALNNNGVDIADVRRIFDANVSKSLQIANSGYGMSDMLIQQLAQLETLLDGDTNSIGTYLNTSLSALRELNAHAGDEKGRSLYLQQLNILTNRFNAINGQMQLSQKNTNDSMASMTSTINQITQKIASINLKMAQTQSTNDASLLDQREGLLRDLAEYVDFTTQTDSSGLVNVIIGNGTSLVFGINSFDLTTVENAENPSNVDLAIKNNGSNVIVTNAITGGEMGGLISYRTKTLEQAQRALNRLSLSVMSEMNKQNALGVDLYGNLGGNIFGDINATNLANARVIANLNNTGSELMSVNITDTKLLTTSDYQLVFDTATSYILTRRSDNTVVSTGAVGALPMSISADGFSINVASGTIAAGDHFLISPTQGAANVMAVNMTDPKLLAMAWPVSATANPANSPGGNIKVSDIIDTTNGAFSIPKELNPPIRIRFTSATEYEIINATTSAVIQANIPYDSSTGVGTNVFPTPAPTSYDPGYRITLSGQMVAGDEFNLTYNLNNTADNRNGLIMEKLYTAATLEGGMTFTSGYHALTIDVSTQANRAQIDFDSNKAIRKAAHDKFSSISGVNEQEELVDLARYQQAYQASAQIIQVAKSIFESIIGIVRG